MDLSTIFGRTIIKNQDTAGSREMDVAGVRGVVAVGTNDPPVSPTLGDTHVVGTGPLTGAFVGHSNHVARYNDAGAWTFEVPFQGWLVDDGTSVYHYSGSTWSALASSASVAAALAAANEADDTADAAQSTANTALANAATALAAANEADDTADAAQATADSAVTAAATALAAANEADDTADAAQSTANTAAANALIALFELASGVNPATVRHLYVDPVAGNDANDGLTSSTPVQTAARLFALLPKVIAQPTLVHMASGILDLSGSPIPYIVGTRLLCFYADEAWDPRGDLYTIVESGAAGVGTNGSDIVAAGAQTANARRCMSIRFTTGSAANGQRRTISRNTTTAFSPAVALSPAPASGDTYQVFTSNAVIRVAAGQTLTASNPSNSTAEGYSFIGVEFDCSSSSTLLLGAAYHQFHGCRVRTNLFGPSFLSSYGTVDTGQVLTTSINSQFGLGQANWDGWSLATENTTAGPSPALYALVIGRLVSKGPVTNTGRFQPNGGYILRLTQATGSSGSSNLSGPSTTLPLTVGDAADTDTKLNCSGGLIRVQNNTRVQNTSATLPAISAEQTGRVLIAAATLVGENANASGPDVRARYGGHVLTTFAAAPAFGKATSVYVCESTSVDGKTTLTSAGAAIRDAAAPESIIRRVA